MNLEPEIANNWALQAIVLTRFQIADDVTYPKIPTRDAVQLERLARVIFFQPFLQPFRDVRIPLHLTSSKLPVDVTGSYTYQ